MTTLLDDPPALEPTPDLAGASGRTADLLVVGAGVMGSWTAFFARAGGEGPDGPIGGGRSVTLLDAWGAGHPRGTSNDDTRVTRGGYGGDALYSRWSRRALALWRRYEQEWGVELFLPSGVLWLAANESGWVADSERTLASLGVPTERLTPQELVRRWPQFEGHDDLAYALHEPEGGALMARRGCLSVVSAFQRAGGGYAVAAVTPGRRAGGRLLDVVDTAGRAWSADRFVFACGPWLPRLFPELLGGAIRVTRQDVLFVGPPAGDRRFHWRELPVWCEYETSWYGIGATDAYGMKLAIDRYGPVFDPTDGERVVGDETLLGAREHLRRRFPALADQPFVGTRVCQYEATVDGHLLIVRHPDLDNVWLVGGGSGHAFKHGPRIGEYLVSRLDGAPEGASDGDDEHRFRLGPRLPTHADWARDAGGPGDREPA